MSYKAGFKNTAIASISFNEMLFPEIKQERVLRKQN